MANNNVNTNLTQRLFAYISRHEDVTEQIKQVYKNSLIFVGDEQQIYVPLYETYVGIGMTTYNNLNSKIDQVSSRIDDLSQTIQNNAVTGIYAQWSDKIRPTAPGEAEPMGESALGAQRLGGDVTVIGQGNYNAFTGFSYTDDQIYSTTLNQWVTAAGNATTAQSDTNRTNATSGIRITYQYDTTTVELNGEAITVPVRNKLVIDDSLTWSYMTSAYTYSLGFTRDYTNTEINKLYQNILGIGDSILMPVSDSSLWEIDPRNGNRVWINTNTLYYKLNADAGLDEYTDTAKWGTTTTNVTPEGTVINPDPDAPTHPQYYVLVSNYDNSYNMNISDGIQTLREVAYILDKITDGALGGVTYLTKDEWDNDSGPNLDAVTPVGNAYTYGGVTYYRVTTKNGVPTTNTKKYGYYIVESDPENIGIQIAYSIAGNKADIEDLHYHIDLAENGDTTMRSFTTTNSNLVNLYNWSNRSFVQTDTEETLESNAYNVGDVNLRMNLDLAKTSVTVNQDYTVSTVNLLADPTAMSGIITDIPRFGIFEKVDFASGIPTWTSGTYYIYNSTSTGDKFTLTESEPEDWPSTIGDIGNYAKLETSSVDGYYWIPQQNTAYTYANNTFTKIDAVYYANHSSDNPAVEYFVLGNDGKFTKVASPTATDAANYYIKNESTTPDYVQHAILDGENHIATTAWVSAFYNDSQEGIQNSIDNILDDAKQYTDDKIDALDSDSKYSYIAFEEWIAADASRTPTGTPGTTAYETSKNDLFEQYVSDVDNLSNKYVGAYVSNRLRSQYISQIVETDGIIDIAETNELPTDQLDVNIYMSKYDPDVTFSEIEGNSDETLFAENVFAVIYNSGNEPKQIYTYANLGQSKYMYVPVTPTSETPVASLYVRNLNGTFEALEGDEGGKVKEAVVAENTNSPYYHQLYRQDNYAYCEIDLDSFTYTVSGANRAITGFSYLNPVTGATITVTGSDFAFYTKNIVGTDKKQYITGSINHYDYTVDGGEGQNGIKLDVNITNIEDATPTNTGFADAWDVKDYITNLFSWVNISASVPSEILNARTSFYDEFNSIGAGNTYVTPTTNLYTNQGTSPNNDFVEIYNGTTFETGYTKLHVGKDANGNLIDWDADQRLAAENRVGIANTDFTAITYIGANNAICVATTYTRNQEVFINPINMSTTVAH